MKMNSWRLSWRWTSKGKTESREWTGSSFLMSMLVLSVTILSGSNAGSSHLILTSYTFNNQEVSESPRSTFLKQTKRVIFLMLKLLPTGNWITKSLYLRKSTFKMLPSIKQRAPSAVLSTGPHHLSISRLVGFTKWSSAAIGKLFQAVTSQLTRSMVRKFNMSLESMYSTSELELEIRNQSREKGPDLNLWLTKRSKMLLKNNSKSTHAVATLLLTKVSGDSTYQSSSLLL